MERFRSSGGTMQGFRSSGGHHAGVQELCRVTMQGIRSSGVAPCRGSGAGDTCRGSGALGGPCRGSGALLEPREVLCQRTSKYLKRILDREFLNRVEGYLPNLKAFKAFLYMSSITTILSNFTIPNMDVNYKLQHRFN